MVDSETPSWCPAQRNGVVAQNLAVEGRFDCCKPESQRGIKFPSQRLTLVGKLMSPCIGRPEATRSGRVITNSVAPMMILGHRTLECRVACPHNAPAATAGGAGIASSSCPSTSGPWVPTDSLPSRFSSTATAERFPVSKIPPGLHVIWCPPHGTLQQAAPRPGSHERHCLGATPGSSPRDRTQRQAGSRGSEVRRASTRTSP